MAALGVRNNNAGNLEASPWTQSQPGYVGSDGRFAQFDTPDNGLNALSSLLTNKYNKGLTTPRQIIGSWAPSSDGNNVDAYSKYVGSAAGIGPDDALTPDHLPAVARAIAQYESPGALSQANKGAPVADPNQPGALDTSNLYGQGALQNGGQQPSIGQVAGGPGGVGDTLQNVGAWLQAANNPGGAASLLQGLQAKQERFMPKPMSMGTDPLTGKIRYGLFDPRTNRITPMQSGGTSNPDQGQFAGDGSDFTDALQQHAAGKIDTPTLMQAAGPMVAGEADALIKGNANPNNLGNRNPMLRQGGIALAHVLDPNFNENQIPARAAIVKSMTSPAPGSFGGAIASSEAVANHAEVYMDAARKLQQLQWGGGVNNDVNSAQAWLKSHSNDTEYKSLVKSMDDARDFIAGEAVKSAAGSNGSMSERRATADTLATNLSLPEKQKAISTLVDIVTGKVEPLVNNYNEAFGLTGKPGERSVDSFLSPKTKQSISNVMSSSSTPSAPAAPAAGGFTGRTASGPNGAKLRETSNGDWVQ